MKNLGMKLVTLGLAATMAALPALSLADGRDCRPHHSTNWNNVAIGSAAIGVLGFLDHNDTVGVIGTAGAVYAGIRADDHCRPVRPVVIIRRDRDRCDYRR